jgi:amino acid transporter
MNLITRNDVENMDHWWRQLTGWGILLHASTAAMTIIAVAFLLTGTFTQQGGILIIGMVCLVLAVLLFWFMITVHLRPERFTCCITQIELM